MRAQTHPARRASSRYFGWSRLRYFGAVCASVRPMSTRLSSRGILVAIEGIDGAGKTTQASILESWLTASNLTVVRTKEPTEGPWGRRLRDSASLGRLTLEEELSAFIEDRRQHVREVIEPALAAGAVVIVDRYYFSNAAYQGSRGMDPNTILSQNESFAPQPDLLVLLDVDPATGIRRIANRGDVVNLFEREEDLAKCATIFSSIDRPYLLRLDGKRSVEEISVVIATVLREQVLFKKMCLKSNKQECEPEQCIFRLSRECNYVKMSPPQFAPLKHRLG